MLFPDKRKVDQGWECQPCACEHYVSSDADCGECRVPVD